MRSARSACQRSFHIGGAGRSVDGISRNAGPGSRTGGHSGTNHMLGNSARSPTRVPHYESRKLANLGGFDGDALRHHLDWLRYLEDDRRRSDFRERLHLIGCWCRAITVSWLRADGAAVLQEPSLIR
jgi:hypothetical protein